MYVISCVIDDEWYYAGFKFLEDATDPESTRPVFYAGMNDQMYLFDSIKQAIDAWEEIKGNFAGADLQDLAIRKIVFKRKKKLEVAKDGEENSGV